MPSASFHKAKFGSLLFVRHEETLKSRTSNRGQSCRVRSEDWFSSEEGSTPARRVLGLKGRPLSASQTPGRSSPAAAVRAGAETGEAGLLLCVCLLSRGRGPGTDGQALPQRSTVTEGGVEVEAELLK